MQADTLQSLGHCVRMLLRNVYDDQVLGIGSAQFSGCILFCQLGRGPHLLGGDSSPEHRCACIKKAWLFLCMYASVVAEYIRRHLLCSCRFEMKAKTVFNRLQE